MMLTQLKEILQTRRLVNLYELSQLLQAQPDAVRAMLQHWIRKGCVKKCLASEGCGSKCVKCSPLMTECYQWLS